MYNVNNLLGALASHKNMFSCFAVVHSQKQMQILMNFCVILLVP